MVTYTIIDPDVLLPWSDSYLACHSTADRSLFNPQALNIEASSLSTLWTVVSFTPLGVYLSWSHYRL